MATLQAISIWDLTAAMVLATWTGYSGFMLIRVVSRIMLTMVDRAANRQKVYDLQNKVENLEYDLSQAKRHKRV